MGRSQPRLAVGYGKEKTERKDEAMIQTRTVSQVLGAVMLTILILALTACGSGSAQEEAKARPLPLYENALRPGGFLVLGKAERPVGAQRLGLVTPCIYRRDRA